MNSRELRLLYRSISIDLIDYFEGRPINSYEGRVIKLWSYTYYLKVSENQDKIKVVD